MAKRASEATVIIDGAGFIEMANAQVEQTFGYSRMELLGQPIEMLMPVRFRKYHSELNESYFTKLQLQLADADDLKGLRKDGTEFPIEIELNPIDTQQKTLFLATIVDRSSLLADLPPDYIASIIKASSDAIISKNLAGIITSWNPAAETMFGYAADEIIGQHISLLIPPDRLNEEDLVLEQIRGGKPVEHYHSFRRGKDGREIAASLTISAIYSPEGAIIGASKIVRDITKELRSQQQMARERDTAQRYLDVAGVMILVIDIEGNVTLINRRGCEILGYEDPKDIIGKSWLDFIPEQRRDAMRETLGRVVRKEEASIKFDTNSVITRSGEERILAWHNSLLRDEDGLVTATLSSGDDITEHTRMEETLRDRESLLANAQRVAALGIWELDVPSNNLIWSDQTYRIFGIAPENFDHSFESFVALIHPDDVERFKSLYLHRPSDSSPVECEYRILRPDGEERIVYERGEVVCDSDGSPLRKLGVVWDITDLKQTEQALGLSEARFRELAENIQEVFWLTSVAKDEILYVSPAFETMWGHPCSALYKSPSLWFDVIHEEDRPRIIEASIKRQGTREYNEEYRIVRPDGVIRWISDRAFPIRDESGQICRLAGVAEDITDRKQAEARTQALQVELLQMSRVMDRGHIASSLEHELNQPLAAVLNYVNAAHQLMSKVEEPQVKRALEYVEKAIAQTERTGQVIRRMREFNESGKSKRSYENLNKAIEESIPIALVGWSGAGIKIRLDLHPDLPSVFMDRIQIQQVALNLIRNAMEAMQKVSRRELTISTKLEGSDFAAVTVSDTGHGMPAEVYEQLFVPFSSTKPDGMGIGLSICRSIMESHKGSISALPNMDGGVDFSFRVPLVRKPEINHEV